MDQKEKRKRVMGRSMKLGHCVCDPRKPCPCPLFKEQDVCTCAGERVPVDGSGNGARLTEHVRSAGCASKIGQKDLLEVLRRLPDVEDPRLLVGTATADDAGVFRLTPEITIVQTVDVFTPGVDDPELFGRIAACNSLSDVYAMGGTPVTALSIIGFPIESLPQEVMAKIIRGGMKVLDQAGTILLGGHSINDEEVKFGFAVTGIINASDVITNAGAEPGDFLILTKPLGTGIVSLAGQIGRASPRATQAAAASMCSLNKVASEVMVRHGATACTDVTGFGLLGHLCQLVTESEVTAEIWADALPLFPDVHDYAEEGMFSGANERNAEYCLPRTTLAGDVPETARAILFDAQTSGGLLIAVPGHEAEDTLAELKSEGVEHASIVGQVTGESEGQIVVKGRSQTAVPEQPTHRDTEEPMTNDKDTAEEECCAHGSPTPDKAMKMFQDFIGSAMQPGAVDVVTKELIAVALGLAVNCVPCSTIHIKKALGMGIGKDELEEAAALATVYGGCRAMMLWNQLKKELL